MNKVYDLIKISMPKKEYDDLVFDFETNRQILSLGLYNDHNEELMRIPSSAYVQNGTTLKLRPLEIDVPNGGEFILGAEVGEGLAYFKFPNRNAKYLWESYFDFGISNKSSLNTYAYLNLGGKISFINANKVELDTNVLRIPYIATMESLFIDKVEKKISFEFSLVFDEIKFSPEKGEIRPVLSLIDYEEQNIMQVSDFIIEEKQEGLVIRGEIEFSEDVFLGNYYFAFEVREGGQTYYLNVYRVRKELFNAVHPQVKNCFVIQGYDCELFWIGRESLVLSINKLISKRVNLPLFGDYSLDKRLSKKTKLNEKLEASYQEFEKEWIHRSSYRKF